MLQLFYNFLYYAAILALVALILNGVLQFDLSNVVIEALRYQMSNAQQRYPVLGTGPLTPQRRLSNASECAGWPILSFFRIQHFSALDRPLYDWERRACDKSTVLFSWVTDSAARSLLKSCVWLTPEAAAARDSKPRLTVRLFP